MIYITGHNIFTEGGFGSSEVYSKARAGKTFLALRDGDFGVPQPFVSSIIPRENIILDSKGLTFLEKAMILSAQDAIERSGIDASSERTIFIISSTKGNIDLLESDPSGKEDERLAIWHSAAAVTKHFGNKNIPVCVTNACTSGVCAQIYAMRALESGKYDDAVVIGADFLSKFIVSGFQCLKALSPERCRPFDKDRKGLNLSEAVATIVFSVNKGKSSVAMESGCIRNDANHISAPSRTAVGQISAIKSVMAEDIAFVNVHGTATIYNDNMESVALYGTGLTDKPVVSYKSLFGHTLGAAGVMETVLSALALEEGVVLPVPTYSENGVSYPLNISTELRKVTGERFLKIMSGFGGINAAAMYRRV